MMTSRPPTVETFAYGPWTIRSVKGIILNKEEEQRSGKGGGGGLKKNLCWYVHLLYY